MKKRLASLLLATAFVLAAGAAFAWNVTTPVPENGDLYFNLTGGKTALSPVSADLKANGFTNVSNPFSFAPVFQSTPGSLDFYEFGVTSAVVSKDFGGAGYTAAGLKLNEVAGNVLMLRLVNPGTGAFSQTIPVNFFGNTSMDTAASFDLSFTNNSKDVFDLAFDGVSNVSSDGAAKTGSLTVTVSKDYWGQLPLVATSIDSDIASGDEAVDKVGRGFNVRVVVLKSNPAVCITYDYGSETKTVIKDLVEGTNTIELPTLIGSDTSVDIKTVENIGNVRLVPDVDGASLADDNFTVPTAAKFFAGAKDTGLTSLNLNAGDTKTLFGAPYTLKVSWGGNVALTDAVTSGDATTVINNVSKDVAVSSFSFKKTSDLDAAIAGLNLTPTFGTIDSADFSYTASVDADIKDQRTEADKPLLAAIAFNARVTSPDSAHIAMLGLDMTLEISGDAMSDRIGAANWTTMKGKIAGGDASTFLASFSLFKYFAESSMKVDLLDFVGTDKRDTYFDVSMDGTNNNVLVKLQNVFLADGPSADGKAEAKLETINGREVLVLFDGVRDGWIKDPTFVDGKTAPVSTYTVSGTVKGSDGAGMADVAVSLGTLTPTSTDAMGAYAFAGVSDGTYTATFTKDGYKAQSTSVTVNGANVTVPDVTMVEGANLVLALQNASGTDYTDAVTFYVFNDSDDVVASADVKVGSNASIALDAGDYSLDADDVDGYSLSTDTESFTIASADVTATVTITKNSGGSSSGCNVGFAPMALLLLAPAFFLKK